MSTVREILEQKGRHVQTIGPRATVFDAAVLMNEHKIGALVVCASDAMVGVITERDILQRVVATRRAPADTLVEDVMTTEVVYCEIDTTIDEARGVMKNRRIRHLPVLNGGQRLLGMISIGDLNAFENNSQEKTIHLLHEYIYGMS